MSSKNEMSTDTNGTLRVFLCQSVKGSGSEARFSDPTQIEINAFDPAAFDKPMESALIICADPIVQICAYITQGLTYAEALNRWVDDAKDLLARQRCNRRRILLVDDRYFATAPTAGLKVLEARLGVSLGEPVAYQAPEPDPLLRVLVTHGVNTNEPVSALISELDAVSLGSDPMPLDIDQAFLFHQETQARLKESFAEQRSQQDTRAIYTAHIVELQSELEKTQDRALNLHRQQVSELQTELQALSESEKSLQDQLQHVMDERDQHAENVQALGDHAPDLNRQQVIELQAELRALSESEKSLQDQLQHIMVERDQHAENMRALQDRAPDLSRQQVIELQAELRALGESEQSLKDQLQHVMNERDQHAENMRALQDRAPDLSRQQVIELQAELRALGESEQSLKDQLQYVMNERDQHAENMRALQDRAPDLSHQQVIELQRELGLAITRENALEEGLQKATQERDLHAQKLQVMQDAVLEARRVYEAAEGRRSQTFEELSQTDQRAMLQFQQIKRLHTQLQNAKAEALQNSAMIEQMRQERTTLAERISWLETDRLKILSSGSWAVTKPLRSVNKILGGSAKKKD